VGEYLSALSHRFERWKHDAKELFKDSGYSSRRRARGADDCLSARNSEKKMIICVKLRLARYSRRASHW